MAVTFTELSVGGSTANADSYTTASVTLTANRLYLMSINVAPSLPTAVATTGGAVTFTSINNITSGSCNDSIWWVIPSSTVTATILISRTTSTGAQWSVVEATGFDPSGTIVQSKTGSTFAYFLSVVLNSNITAGNARFTAGPYAGEFGTFTPSSGTWTGTGTSNITVPSIMRRSAYNSTPATTDKTITWTPSYDQGVIGAVIIEVKASTSTADSQLVGAIPI